MSDEIRQQVEALNFAELQETNRRRCEQAFHSVDEWKPWEWSNAMAGECGEACNVTKKMARIWPANQFKQNWNKPEDQRMAELEDKLADELADVVIYADLLATRIGRNLGECVRRKFNEKSDEIGSQVKLPELSALLRDAPKSSIEHRGDLVRAVKDIRAAETLDAAVELARLLIVPSLSVALLRDARQEDPIEKNEDRSRA